MLPGCATAISDTSWVAFNFHYHCLPYLMLVVVQEHNTLLWVAHLCLLFYSIQSGKCLRLFQLAILCFVILSGHQCCSLLAQRLHFPFFWRAPRSTSRDRQFFGVLIEVWIELNAKLKKKERRNLRWCVVADQTSLRDQGSSIEDLFEGSCIGFSSMRPTFFW